MARNMATEGVLSRRVSFHTGLSTTQDSDGVKCIGVFTSGGDSQGMNAALRGVVRVALFKGMRVYLIKEGYSGLVTGGENIKECTWSSVSYIMQRGGTVIGTARCNEFRTREGRLKAAKNLVQVGISGLVVIGGDGSLTGADLFKKEWPDLLAELATTGQLSQADLDQYPYLNIVGLVGSIDNDMCGTDMTIGSDSALHRIVEAIDNITSTASSHQRSFVLEVMGRNCGYLALMGGIAGGADWVLLPENPPREGWEKVMCEKLETCRSQGRRLNLVIISEGAVDQSNRRITAQYVKETIDNCLGYDTRITVLGHIQRGGKPSAYDRILGTRMGAAASLVLYHANREISPTMIALQGNEIVEVPLMKFVSITRSIDTALKECQFERVKELRGRGFQNNLKIMKKLEACSAPVCQEASAEGPKYCLAVMNVGAPAGGTNSATRAFVRLALYGGHRVLGIHEGFEGILNNGGITEMTWSEVSEWGSLGGSNLGTNRTRPNKDTIPKIAAKFKEYGIQALLMVGGFEAFESMLILEEARSQYQSFCIPMILVAATISNNVPGTEYSLGCDTALNVIVSAVDVLKQSATGSRKRCFVVETMGGYCGYLATMGALAGGADSAYIFEEPFKLVQLQKDFDHLVQKFQHRSFERGLILRNEKCNESYTTDFMTRMLAEEGEEYFVARNLILGHLQQGDRPSPFDRILGVKYASHALARLLEQIRQHTDESGTLAAATPTTANVLGIVGLEYIATPLRTLKEHTDFKHRIPKEQWWMQLRPLIRVLARHQDLDFKGESHRQRTGTSTADGDETSSNGRLPQNRGLNWFSISIFAAGALLALLVMAKSTQ